jgi:glyoxylase-like metal-dependent hydrolase (beta-lactamase superfamily II)
VAFNALEAGAARLYWLDGGGFRLDGGAIFGPVPRPRWVAAYPPAEDNTIPLTAHVLLVQASNTWGLIDSGFGHHLADRQRRCYSLERESHLEQGLAEIGINKTRIDWVVLSHLHLDHAGGIVTDNDATFPNASVHVQQLEAREAHDPTNRAHGVYGGDAFDRLEAFGLIQQVDGEADVGPHVRVFLTGGHSRGHQVTLIGNAVLHLGDLLVTGAHLPPAWVSALDDFPLDTIRAKREWLGRVAREDWWVTFSHDARHTAARLDGDGKARELRSVRP